MVTGKRFHCARPGAVLVGLVWVSVACGSMEPAPVVESSVTLSSPVITASDSAVVTVITVNRGPGVALVHLPCPGYRIEAATGERFDGSAICAASAQWLEMTPGDSAVNRWDLWRGYLPAGTYRIGPVVATDGILVEGLALLSVVNRSR